MLSTCANPDCAVPFDHRSGRFFSFHRSSIEGHVAANTHSVQHFWLCKSCCEVFTLEYASGLGVMIRQPHRVPVGQPASRVIVAA
jgi:hypothetical protein